MKPKQYRNNGAIGAILDEYERAIDDLKEVIKNISDDTLKTIIDDKTEDEDCRSIQTILTHVVRSGYGYAINIRKKQGEDLPYRLKIPLNSAKEYGEALDKMFDYNVRVFEDYPDIELEEFDNALKMLVPWGQYYDVEQMMEHAIVHILRHRRQIERFLIKYNAVK
jgi:uncharacterized damage-inducible protein DinB